MAEIWKYFKKLPSDAEKAQCLRCSQILICKGSSTCGLLRHLQIKHNILCKRQAQPTNDQQHEAGPSSSKPAIPSMMNYVKRRNLNEEVACHAAKDGFSVNGLTNSEFIRQSFAARGMRLPLSKNTIMKLVQEFFNEAKAKTMLEIQNRIVEGQSVSLTLDEWTSLNNKRYININTHFTNGMMINLGLVLIKGSLPAEKVVETVEGALKDFDFKPSNVFGATTDAAAVMVKFGRTSGYWHQLCYNHGIHLAVCDVIYKKTPQEPVIEDDSSDDDDDEGSEEDFADEDGIAESGLYNSSFGVILKQVRKVVKIFRKSSIKNGLLQEKLRKSSQQPLNLLLDVKTRWNSTEAMVERFLKIWNYVKEVLIDLGQGDILTNKDIKIMSDLLNTFQPIRLASEALGRRDANLLTAEGTLSFLFNKLKELDTPISKDMYDALVRRNGERRNKELVSIMMFLNNKSLSSTPELPGRLEQELESAIQEYSRGETPEVNQRT